MSRERHARLTAAFDELSALGPGPARDAHLRALCADDAGLRAELELLLRFDDEEEEGGDDLLSGKVLRSDLDAIWEGAAPPDGEAAVPARYEIVRRLQVLLHGGRPQAMS